MPKYLVLMINEDPFCGGDYEFFESEKDMFYFLKYYSVTVTHILDVSSCKDLTSYYKGKIDFPSLLD